MRTFEQKSKTTRQTTPVKSTKTSRSHYGQSHEVSSVPHLHRMIGNQSVLCLQQAKQENHDANLIDYVVSTGVDSDFSRVPVHTNTNSKLQAKLKVNVPGDKYEQEANRVADLVMRMPSAKHSGEYSSAYGVRRDAKTRNSQAKLAINPVQGSYASGSEIHSAFASYRSYKGTPIDSVSRNYMEIRFGQDFRDIRVHTDSEASRLSDVLQAKAFTKGSDIYFNNGQYNPNSNSGRRLLAHELTHTVQQRATASVDFIQRDLAVEPANPDAVVRELSDDALQDAIDYNNRWFTNEDEIRNLRDVLGIISEPPTIDGDLVRAVVEWQAISNLDQDGKIGPRTARIIGREMLAESRLDRAQRIPARQMLEKGITLSLANNNYTDTATTSIKNIRFNVFIPRGLNMRDYALVNFLRGEMLIVPGPVHPNVRMYGALVPFNFPAEQVDSVDADPIYWSTAGSRWNYNIAGRNFSATDAPGPRSGNTFNPGESANVNFRIAVFRVRDLPVVTAGNVGATRPLVSRRWRFSVVRDVAGNITHP